ncbi:efflux RND transporter periplasmic adaptor subunit [Winogradskyella sp.]|uniref:efflux RND transporter periplasmic adaptor subunit n=1 Tax=Winogradskyella sp. TaxID=1883156 RepID=UPI0026085720|nr:efflux RND transporter periplasmic adaptor subunit [Winogradskyella sp.]
MKKKHYLIALTAIATLGCGKQQKLVSDKSTDFQEFQAIQVSPAEIQNTINLTGRIVPIQKVDIIAEVQGTASLGLKPFKEGVSFRKGELMLSLDNSQFRYNLNSQRSQFLSSMVNTISDIQLDYPNEFPTWNRFLKQINVEERLPELPKTKNEQLRYFLNSRNIYNLFYSIRSKEEQLKDYYLYAPFSGTLKSTFIDEGNLVRPGVKLGEFIRTDSYEIKSAVTADKIDEFKIGQKVEFFARNINKKVEGVVKRIGKSLDVNTQSVNVYFRVSDHNLKEGMYVEADYPIGVFKEVVAIKNNLITRENRVHIIKDSMVVSKAVKVLKVKEAKSIVAGLNKGDVLVTEVSNKQIVGIKAIPKLQ